MDKAVNRTLTPVEELVVRLFRAPRILVVQDSVALVESMLHRNYDCQVDTTSSGQHALNLLQKQTYDMVMLDLALLNGTGEAVLREAQKRCPSTPLVVTKGSKTDLDRLMPQVGSLMLLSSPVTEDALNRLFRLFKIKARTREIAQQCATLGEWREQRNQPVEATAG